MSLENTLNNSVHIVDPEAYYGDPKIGPPKIQNEALFWNQMVGAGSTRLKKLAAKVSILNLWGIKHFTEYFAKSDIVAIIMLFDLDGSKEQINPAEIVGPMVDFSKSLADDPRGIKRYDAKHGTAADRQSVSRQPLFFLERALVRVCPMIGKYIRENRPRNDLEQNIMDTILSSPTQKTYEPGWLLKKINNH